MFPHSNLRKLYDTSKNVRDLIKGMCYPWRSAFTEP